MPATTAGGPGGFEHRTLRHDDVDRPQAAGIHRDVAFDHDTEGIKHGGTGDGLGRVEIVFHDGRSAGEVHRRFALFMIDSHLHTDDLAGVSRVITGRLLRQASEHAAHAFGGIVLHVAHIGDDGGQREMRDHLAQLCHALFIGGDLGLEVGDVLPDIADRMRVVGEKVDEFGLTKPALRDEVEIVDQDTFVFDTGGERGHGAGGGTADIGMMAARGDVEEDVWFGGIA